jgi:hypothetical protein
MADVYRQKVMALREALDEEEARPAAEALRTVSPKAQPMYR